MGEARGFERFERAAAESYERHFVPLVARPVALRLVERSALAPGERVLDLACGTGVVARLAAAAVAPAGSVDALDRNAEMLLVGRAAPHDGVEIRWEQGSAEDLPLDDGSYDVALCQMGLQFFDDRSTALREVRRVLADGGRFVANVAGPTPPPFAVLADSLTEHLGPDIGGFVHAVFSLHDPEALQSLARNAGFEDVEVSVERQGLDLGPPADFLWKYVRSTPLARAFDATDAETRETIERQVTQAWEPLATGGSLRGAVQMLTVEAR